MAQLARAQGCLKGKAPSQRIVGAATGLKEQHPWRHGRCHLIKALEDKEFMSRIAQDNLPRKSSEVASVEY
jgi:hypothetical protein